MRSKNIYDSEKYQEYRKHVEAHFVDEKFNKTIRQTDHKEFHLDISSYKTEDGCWNYTRGILVNEKGSVIADIKRNYHSFPFCFVDHPNGNTYLVCGEDYQGYTIVNCNSGISKTFIPEAWQHGCGFCWSEIDEGGDSSTFLFVEGCGWGAPFEIITYDFDDPDTLPLPELDRRDAEDPDDDEDEDEDYDDDDEEDEEK